MEWIVTNLPYESKAEVFKAKNFRIYSNVNNQHYNTVNFQGSSYHFLFTGYCVPRLGSYPIESGTKLIENLFSKYGFEFIQHLKGAFNILVFDELTFWLFSDHHGIEKYFTFSNHNNFIISNELKNIVKKTEKKVNPNNIAIQALFNHYVNGITFLDKVFFNTPASVLEWKENKIITKIYYDIHKQLFDKKEGDISFEEFASIFSNITKSYIEATKSKNVSLTLTGGKDSRTILASLLHNGIRPFTFTYGSDQSSDAYYAKKIAKDRNLDYRCFFPQNLSPQWFDQLSNEIIEKGQSLVNIHRAHRVDAIKALKTIMPDNQLFMGGYMGGELMMGIYYDNLIITDFIREWNDNVTDRTSLIRKYLNNHYFNLDAIDENYIQEFCCKLPFLDAGNKDRRDFSLQFYIAAYVHHLADIFIYMKYLRFPVPIFLDIDFLELLFGSKFNFLNMDNSSKNPIKRFKMFELNMNIQNILAPELSHLHFAKKGSYNTKEFLGNKYSLLSKRIIRKMKSKSFPSSFSLGSWLKEYVGTQFDDINNMTIESIYDIKKAKIELNNGNHTYTESTWHKFTDIVMLNLLLKKY